MWDVLQILDRDVVVETGTTLKITCKVLMPKDGKITVHRGAKLIIDGGHITNMCGNNAWYGIEVWGNKLIGQPSNSIADIITTSSPLGSNDHGVLVIKNNSVIENAQNAIKLARTESWGNNLEYTGGIVLARNSQFINNKRTAEFLAYPNAFPVSAPSYWRSISSFYNCRFETNMQELHGHAKPDAQITMWQIHGIEMKNDTFRNTIPYPDVVIDQYYSPRGHGIRAIDADFIATDNIFSGLNKGIYFPSSGSICMYTLIKDNVFSDNIWGIDFSGTYFAKVVRNTINVHNPIGFGIHNTANVFFQMEDNTINIHTDASYFNYGINNVNTGNIYNTIYRNTINATGSGINPTTGISNSLNNLGLFMQCNEFTGLMGNIQVYSGGIRPSQGSCPPYYNSNRILPADNIFTSSCSNSTYRRHVFANPNANSFIYASEPGYLPVFQCIKRIHIDFCPTLGSRAAICPSHFPDEDPCGIGCIKEQIAGIGIEIVNRYHLLDGNKTSQYLSIIKNVGISNSDLFDSIAVIDTMVSDDILLNLIHRPSVDVDRLSGLLVKTAPHTPEVLQEIKELGSVFSSDSLDKILFSQDSMRSRKQVVDTIALLKAVKGDNYVLLAHKIFNDSLSYLPALYDSLNLETDVYLRLMLADLYIADSLYAAAKTIYDSLPILNREIRNLKRLRTIDLYFKSHNWNWFSLVGEGAGTDYLSSIDSIAVGDSTVAAFQAQAIKYLIAGDSIIKIWEFENDTSSKRGLSEEHSVKLSKPNSIVEHFALYPNPAKNNFTIKYKFSEDGDNEFLIIDILGKTVLRKSILKEGEELITSTKIPQGLYLYLFKQKGIVIYSGKISIIQ